MSTKDRPLHRPSARIVVIDDRDRVLLFRTDIRGVPLWITPGGGVDPGESYEQCARRELWEETGLRLDVGPCVWVRRHLVEFNGIWVDAVERIYVARTPAVDVTHENWVAGDHMMTSHHWWSLDEIADSDHWFAPRRLLDHLPPLMRGQYPLDPIDCGV